MPGEVEPHARGFVAAVEVEIPEDDVETAPVQRVLLADGQAPVGEPVQEAADWPSGPGRSPMPPR
jgi:hypothetical protein